ncbi:hypothetical protein A3Q37_03040 [Streptomyces sp. PTY087I2]|nr:hypothetical protein A3Q37_03040 [Streptomyces sp. PTY087I2]
MRAHRCGRGRRDAYAVEVDGTGVAATGLVRAGRLHGGGRLDLLRGNLRLGRHRTVFGHGRPRRRRLRDGLALRGGRGGLRVAPGTLGGRHQQKVVVLGGVLGGVEEGVRVRGGDARLLHHACVLRQSLARDLAGVSHAYPSPIVSAPSALRPGRRTTARRCSSSRTSGLAARHETPAGFYSRGRSPPRQAVLPRLTVDCATLRVPRVVPYHSADQNSPLFRTLTNETTNARARYNNRPAYLAYRA